MLSGLFVVPDVVLSCCSGVVPIWGWSTVLLDFPFSLSVSSMVAAVVVQVAGMFAAVSDIAVAGTAGWMTPRFSRDAGVINLVVWRIFKTRGHSRRRRAVRMEFG